MRATNQHGGATYADFLAPWKDADPDIPILQQGTEYEKVK